ncbi:MAG: hypothetical protein JNM93_03705 [Bacteriovoracaceae bacterium]|nr:hypothetical protein [Bacteriovoracaceae bacterium]
MEIMPDPFSTSYAERLGIKRYANFYNEQKLNDHYEFLSQQYAHELELLDSADTHFKAKELIIKKKIKLLDEAYKVIKKEESFIWTSVGIQALQEKAKLESIGIHLNGHDAANMGNEYIATHFYRLSDENKRLFLADFGYTAGMDSLYQAIAAVLSLPETADQAHALELYWAVEEAHKFFGEKDSLVTILNSFKRAIQSYYFVKSSAILGRDQNEQVRGLKNWQNFLYTLYEVNANDPVKLKTLAETIHWYDVNFKQIASVAMESETWNKVALEWFLIKDVQFANSRLPNPGFISKLMVTCEKYLKMRWYSGTPR